MYNHSLDKTNNKWGEGEKLDTLELDRLPEYIKNNKNKYNDWLE